MPETAAQCLLSKEVPRTQLHELVKKKLDQPQTNMGSDDGARREARGWNPGRVASAVLAPALLLCVCLAAALQSTARTVEPGGARRWRVPLPAGLGALGAEWLPHNSNSSAEALAVGKPAGAQALAALQAALQSLHAQLARQEASLDAKLGRRVDRHMERIEELVARGRGETALPAARVTGGERASQDPATPALPRAPPACASPAAGPPPAGIVAARGEDYWPFQRNEVHFNATATPPRCRRPGPGCVNVEPFTMFVHDPKICAFVSGEILKKGAWEPHLTEELMRQLGPPSNGRVFLDVGANIGWFSLNAAAAGHRVIAIDALRTNVELLMRSIEVNPRFKQLIEVYHYAVSSSGGTVAVMRPAPLGAPQVNKANGQVQFGEKLEETALREKACAPPMLPPLLQFIFVRPCANLWLLTGCWDLWRTLPFLMAFDSFLPLPPPPPLPRNLPTFCRTHNTRSS